MYMKNLSGNNWSQKAKTRSIPRIWYLGMIIKGVRCECGEMLNRKEILSHRHIGITKSKDMSCQECWCKDAYGPWAGE